MPENRRRKIIHDLYHYFNNFSDDCLIDNTLVTRLINHLECCQSIITDRDRSENITSVDSGSSAMIADLFMHVLNRQPSNIDAESSISDGSGSYRETPLVISQERLDEFESKKYSEMTNVDPGITVKCSICQSDIENDDPATRLPCGHVFHKNCIDSYVLTINSKCPNCRHDSHYNLIESPVMLQCPIDN